MFYGFLLVVAVFAIAFYVVVIMREVPGMAEERLGKLEDLPPDLGKWKIDETSAAAAAARAEGLVREERLFLDTQGGLKQGKLIRQIRYRNPDTDEIVRVDSDEPVKRKRVKS